jgi:hypothetical protein
VLVAAPHDQERQRRGLDEVAKLPFVLPERELEPLALHQESARDADGDESSRPGDHHHRGEQQRLAGAQTFAQHLGKPLLVRDDLCVDAVDIVERLSCARLAGVGSLGFQPRTHGDEGIDRLVRLLPQRDRSCMWPKLRSMYASWTMPSMSSGWFAPATSSRLTRSRSGRALSISTRARTHRERNRDRALEGAVVLLGAVERVALQMEGRVALRPGPRAFRRDEGAPLEKQAHAVDDEREQRIRRSRRKARQ